MPNEVYQMTHAALSALVSQRAATHVLEAALEGGRHDADTVTVRAMRRLLAGPIRRELSDTFPRPGLTKSLRRLADDLNRLRPSHSTIVLEPYVEGEGSSQEARGGLKAFSERNAGNIESTEQPALLPTPLDLDEVVMMDALKQFGELEPVEQVVIVRRGEILLERGERLNTESIPNLVWSTRHLLARAGELKLFALEREEGILFVFPIGDGAIVVVTKPSVNIGAVLAARAALEEAA